MQRHEFSRYEHLKLLMDDWADWQKGYTGAKGFPDHSLMLQADRKVASDTWEDIIERMDVWVCQMVDAAVDDLHAGHKAAINRCYGISAVFRFPRGNYDALLVEAHDALLVSLPKKGVAI